MIEELQALRIGPDEVLIVRVPEVGWEHDAIKDLSAQLKNIGLGGRSLIFIGEVEFVLTKRDAS